MNYASACNFVQSPGSLGQCVWFEFSYVEDSRFEWDQALIATCYLVSWNKEAENNLEASDKQNLYGHRSHNLNLDENPDEIITSTTHNNPWFSNGFILLKFPLKVSFKDIYFAGTSQRWRTLRATTDDYKIKESPIWPINLKKDLIRPGISWL